MNENNKIEEKLDTLISVSTAILGVVISSFIIRFFLE